MVSDGDIKSKGFTVMGAKAFVEERFDPGSWERVVQELEPNNKAILEGSILPSLWYPFELQVRLYETIDRLFGKGDLALCREIGRFTAESEINKIHRAAMKVGGLSMWLKIAGLLWGQYYSAGKMRCGEVTATGGTVTVSEFNPVSKAFCLDLAGWIERVMELSGKEKVQVLHPKCLLDGAPACVFHGRWRG